ncbi:Hypothetical predicted protein [Lecanosticta acicola]|uniref:Uncharacterized protein n=1 Tax=Lecanosticta acicola TaxID=111012 RepID=A0AAI9E7J8_9PEZI|nr:Hypothetical predicted protein [Lecanosticta acicola]
MENSWGGRIPDEYFSSIHEEILHGRNKNPQAACRFAEHLLEYEYLPIHIRASCHMLLSRGAGHAGVLDIGHAKEAYRLLEQFTYANYKHISDEDWKNRMHWMYKMRRAIQNRQTEIRKQEEQAKGEKITKKLNRRVYMHTNEQGKTEFGMKEFGIGSGDRGGCRGMGLEDPFVDIPSTEMAANEEEGWNTASARISTPPPPESQASEPDDILTSRCNFLSSEQVTPPAPLFATRKTASSSHSSLRPFHRPQTPRTVPTHEATYSHTRSISLSHPSTPTPQQPLRTPNPPRRTRETSWRDAPNPITALLKELEAKGEALRKWI